MQSQFFRKIKRTKLEIPTPRLDLDPNLIETVVNIAPFPSKSNLNRCVAAAAKSYLRDRHDKHTSVIANAGDWN